MISKGEAITRLKKMGVMVADDQSIVTILLPSDIPLSVGIKDIKEKLKSMDYDASFSIRQSRDVQSEMPENDAELDEEEPFDEEDDMEALSEEDLKGSLLSMDDDGQFTLGGFGLDF